MELKGFLTRLLECAIIFTMSAWLIRTAVYYLLDVWKVLAVLAAILFLAIIAWRIYRNRRDTGQW